MDIDESKKFPTLNWPFGLWGGLNLCFDEDLFFENLLCGQPETVFKSPRRLAISPTTPISCSPPLPSQPPTPPPPPPPQPPPPPPPRSPPLRPPQPLHGAQPTPLPLSCRDVASHNLIVDLCNIRGLDENKDCVHQFLETNKPDVLFLTETKVSNYDIDRFRAPDYHLEETFRIQRGVCAYINNNIAYRRMNRFEIYHDSYQTIILKVTMTGKNIIFVALYRSPANDTPLDFFECLEEKIDLMMAENPAAELVILGDFNVHNTGWLIYSDPARNNENGKAAYELACAHSLTQLVDKPTRCPDRPGERAYLLDLYCTSIPAITRTTVTASIGRTDHYLIRSSIDIAVKNASPPLPRKVWHYEHADWDGLCQFLKCFPWDMHCMHNQDVDCAAQAFTETVLHGMDKFIPSSYVIPKRMTWFSRRSRHAVTEKVRAFRKYMRTKSPEDWEHYREVRNQCKLIIVQDKQMFNQRQAEKFAQHPTGSREFWSMVNKVKSNFAPSSLPPLNVDGVPVTDSAQKANILARVFADNCTISSLNANPPPHVRSGIRMPRIYIHKRRVLKELQALDTRKSAGSDNIPPLVLKRCATVLAPIITKIFILSYKKGIFPTIWKLAKVQPVPKRGAKTDPSNYRPISILPVVAKVFERCINQHLVEFLESNKIINEKQFGFREKRSTGDLLIDIAHTINKSLDNGGECIAVALDISKAFDKVWHHNLLSMLKSYGVDERMVKFLESYLSDRKLSVKIDGVSSDILDINAGVPQGSVLAPTLFLIYINLLLSLTQNPVYSYADDSTLLASYTPIKKGNIQSVNEQRGQISTSINQDLERIHDWGEQNLVDFNPTKTQLCNFSRLKSVNEEIITMNNVVLEPCDSVRVLGVTIQKDLRWNDHVREIARGAASKLGFLYRCKRYFSSHQLALIYKAFIRPCIEYCCHVWGGASHTTLKKLDRIQKRAIRLIGNPSITDKFDTLHHRRVVADLTVFYKIYNGQCTEEVRNIISPKECTRDTRQQRSAHDRTVVIDDNILVNTNIFASDFFHRTSRAWNRLPEAVFPPSVDTPLFKRNVNSYLKSLPPRVLEDICRPTYRH